VGPTKQKRCKHSDVIMTSPGQYTCGQKIWQKVGRAAKQKGLQLQWAEGHDRKKHLAKKKSK